MHHAVTGVNVWGGVVVLGVQAAMLAGLAHAEPTRTLPPPYKASDVATLRAQTAELMAMSEEQVLAAVPEQSGVFFADCPNCDKSTADAGNFAWSPARPDQIVCKDCGEVYPDNPRYPDDQVLEVRSIDGMHQYPYYQRPDGHKIYFRARVDFEARAHMAKACQQLAELYWLTGDEACARRAAVILVRFAQVYPGYALHREYPFTETRFAPYDSGTLSPDDPPRTSKWHCWGYMDISTELAGAFDVLRNWPPLAGMAEGRAVALIRDDLLGGMIDYTMAFEETFSNMSPMKWQNAIAAARVIERPQTVHEVVARIERFLGDRFLYDGAWMETSPSYVRQTAGWMQMVSLALEGYEDPAGYVHPVTGKRLDAEEIARVRAASDRSMAIIDQTRFPNGQLLPVNDTWASSTPSRYADHFSVRETTEAALMPGFGVAFMGGGAGDGQYAAYLNFTGGRQHKHRDALSIGLYAGGKELLSDIGYTHTSYRYWATSTASHNTVLVDGRDQAYDPEHRMNRLCSWASDGRGFHVAEAESVGAYPQAARYRRTLFAIGDDAQSVYLVDVFQVHGGSQHDYILTGSADEDSRAEVSEADLQPFDGVLINPGFTFTIPRGESEANDPQSGLGYVRNLRRAPVGERVVLDYRLASSPQVGTRTWLWPGSGTTIHLGEAPSVRRSQGNDSALDDYVMPVTVARRAGRDLKSTFVAVHEPVHGAPRVEPRVVQSTDEAVVLEVRREDAVDYVFVALDGAATVDVAVASTTIRFHGRQGLVRMVGGRPVEAHLVDGTILSVGEYALKGAPPLSGQVVDAQPVHEPGSRGWFEVSTPLPTVEPGTLMLVRYPDGTTQGYHVERVESQSETSRIYTRERPAFRFEGQDTKLTAYPQRVIPGRRVTFELLQAHHRY